MNSNDLVWLTIKGVDKREILEGLGFKIENNGNISLNGEKVTVVDDPEQFVKVSDIKAIVPGSLKVITDISELEIVYSED